MPSALFNTASQPVLVIVDVQLAIDDPMWGPRNNPDAERVIAQLLAAWRSKKLPVIHVRHDSTDQSSAYRPGLPSNAFKPEATPIDGELVVAKTTNSAFIGTDLADNLSALGGSVVYAGVITNNSLEATVRMSGNLGFDSYVVADAAWTVDKTDMNGRLWPAEDVHALALANMNGEYATVVDAADVIAAL